jgi:hypothetical protein
LAMAIVGRQAGVLWARYGVPKFCTLLRVSIIHGDPLTLAGIVRKTICTMSSARRNDSSDACFEDDAFAEGAYRWVAKGRYTKGRRRGKMCVRKWFKRSFDSLEESFFEQDIQAV